MFRIWFYLIAGWVALISGFIAWNGSLFVISFLCFGIAGAFTEIERLTNRR